MLAKEKYIARFYMPRANTQIITCVGELLHTFVRVVWISSLMQQNYITLKKMPSAAQWNILHHPSTYRIKITAIQNVGHLALGALYSFCLLGIIVNTSTYNIEKTVSYIILCGCIPMFHELWDVTFSLKNQRLYQAGPALPVRPVRFWPDHFLEINWLAACACACAYNEVGVAPTCGGSPACVCGQS